MFELRMARLQPARAPILAGPTQTGETAQALGYLYQFRRIVVSLAAVGAALAFWEQLPALGSACVCIGIGEWIESSYYLNVLPERAALAAGERTVSEAVHFNPRIGAH